MFWPLQENIINDQDINMLISFIRETKRFTQFEKVALFEKLFSEWQGSKYCVFVNSGSSANLISINALKEKYNWKDGDEIIVQAVTWPTTVTPVIQCGLKPVFIDANLEDLSFDYGKIESKITSKTKAIMVAHLLGFPAAIEKIEKIIGGRNILLIEDCCESQGAKINGVKVGNFGICSTFSFYWGHHMTTVEGGMVCTNNEDIYKLLLLKRSHGLARELSVKYHKDLKEKYKEIDFNFLFLTDGFNVRNTEFNAVLGISQLDSIDGYIKQRNQNYISFLNICKLYKEHLIFLDVPGVSSFVFLFIFKNKDRKAEFQNILSIQGIESRPIISGNLLLQPFLNHYYNEVDFPNADFLHYNAFYIGNNQFVNSERIEILKELMYNYFAVL